MDPETFAFLDSWRGRLFTAVLGVIVVPPGFMAIMWVFGSIIDNASR